MDYLKFETLDFKQKKGGGGVLLPKNIFSVTTNGKKAAKVRFSKGLTEEVEQFKFLSVKRNPITFQDYLIFNNDNGMDVRYGKKDIRAGVTCNEFVQYLIRKYGGGETHFRIMISENKSNSHLYATYEIIRKVDK